MPEYKRKPELIVIAGPNGSGKTTVTQQFLHHEYIGGLVAGVAGILSALKVGQKA